MIVVVIGVAGVGKTTVGSLLAKELGWRFADADSYHSRENVAKMASGIALTDADREPWLRVLRQAIETWIATGENVVLACSALKQKYRDFLTTGPEVKFVYLTGTASLIEERIRDRQGHYMPGELLKSQFETLEEPASVPTFDVSATPPEIVRNIRQKLQV